MFAGSDRGSYKDTICGREKGTVRGVPTLVNLLCHYVSSMPSLTGTGNIFFLISFCW